MQMVLGRHQLIIGLDFANDAVKVILHPCDGVFLDCGGTVYIGCHW